jgi:hypothetical protein
MQKWEYLEVEVAYLATGIEVKGWIYNENGKYKEIVGKKYGQLFAELGLQGWELAGCASHAYYLNNVGAVSYIFKRPI